MARKQRRQQHGTAWHWKQTDCWYFTEPGTKKRVPLFDEAGDRIRGKECKEPAKLALARIKLSEELSPVSAPKGSGIPLFRSTRCKQWKRCNCVRLFLQLKKKLGLSKDKCLYVARHTFAKRTLSGYYTGKPVTIEVLAGLLGNTLAAR